MKLTVPLTWKDLTLRELVGMMNAENPLEQLAIVSGTTVSILKKLPRKLVQAALNHLEQIKETADFVERFELNGVQYGFIPDWDAFTAGEYIDLEILLEDSWNNAPRIMAVLYRPIKTVTATGYTIEPYTAKEPYNQFWNIPANLFSGMLVFFWTTKNVQLSNTAGRLLASAQRLQKPLPKSGIGTLRYLHWLKRTLRGWTK